MPFNKLPDVDGCCYCIPDLRTATAIIAVFAIITNPVVSWLVVGHAYSIRVSCGYKTNSSRADIVDIRFNNVISFGFGANAGHETSCFHAKKTENVNKVFRSQNISSGDEEVLSDNRIRYRTNESTTTATTIPTKTTFRAETEKSKSDNLMAAIRVFGWILLVVDIVFLIIACMLLCRLFIMPDIRILKAFMYVALVSVIVRSAFGIFFIAICVIVGNSFPIFECIFLVFDFGLWFYFLLVLNAYRKTMINWMINRPEQQ